MNGLPCPPVEASSDDQWPNVIVFLVLLLMKIARLGAARRGVLVQFGAVSLQLLAFLITAHLVDANHLHHYLLPVEQQQQQQQHSRCALLSSLPSLT